MRERERLTRCTALQGVEKFRYLAQSYNPKEPLTRTFFIVHRWEGRSVRRLLEFYACNKEPQLN